MNFSEEDKLEIEFKIAQQYNLNFKQYQIFLDFKDFEIERDQKNAKIKVIEGHDITFDALKPNISKLRNLEHTIFLKKDQGIWQIIEDAYEDDIWEWLQKIALSKEELLNLIETSPAISRSNNPTEGFATRQTYSLPEGKSPYDNNGAVNYAHQYSLISNNKYFYFPNSLGGDCTNFVSQAIHEGGKAPMQYWEGGIGTPGWYYKDINNRATAWTFVDNLYKFIVEEKDLYKTGPEGHLVAQYQAVPGDIIQYERNGDSSFDHSVIIVQTFLTDSGQFFHLIAGHSPEVDNYPYVNFMMGASRYIHIDYVDDTEIFLPVTLNSNNTAFSSLRNKNDEQAYPAPNLSSMKKQSIGYPAPNNN